MTAKIIPFPARPTLWERADAKRKRDHDELMRKWCKAMSEMIRTEYVPDGDPKGAA